MKKRILFIVNSLIPDKRKKKILSLIEEKIDRSSSDYRVEFTLYPHHATELVKNSLDQFDVFAAVGGDGTIREVSTAMIGTGKLLGIIPSGSGNGLARHLDIPRNLQQAVERINGSRFLEIDTAVLNEYHFINVAGMGFDALIAEKFRNSRRRGLFNYFRLVVNYLVKYKPLRYSIETDGEKFTETGFLVSIANSSQFGGGIYISPGSDISDGILELCILKKFPLILSPFIAFELLYRKIHLSRYTRIIPVRKMAIESDSEMPVHLDGDYAGMYKKVQIGINPGSLKIIV